MKNKPQEGYATVEFLIAFPVLLATFFLALQITLVLKSQISLTNATHAAVQAYAKYHDCNKAQEFLNANFDRTGAKADCSDISGEVLTITSTYTYNAINTGVFTLPVTNLQAKASALKIEKD